MSQLKTHLSSVSEFSPNASNCLQPASFKRVCVCACVCVFESQRQTDRQTETETETETEGHTDGYSESSGKQRGPNVFSSTSGKARSQSYRLDEHCALIPGLKEWIWLD